MRYGYAAFSWIQPNNTNSIRSGEVISMAIASRTASNPPGLTKLLREITGRYGSAALSDAPENIREDIGMESGVFCLLVTPEQHGAASQFCAELCGDIEDDFHERYFVIMRPAD